MKPTVAFLVNGSEGSAMGDRARAFADRLCDRFDVHTAYRASNRTAAIVEFVRFLSRVRPALSYVFDMSYSGVVAGAWHRATSGNILVVDTGDVIGALAKSVGNRGPMGLALTRLLEKFGLNVADMIVVRGTYHRELLRRSGVRCEVIQDGVDLQMFAPQSGTSLRKQLDLEDAITVGIVGSSVWSERLGMCYGWDLVELLHLVDDERLHGIMIGDGSGIERLRERAEKLGVVHRLHFLGRVPFDKLPRHLAAIDVCLSTQTNDLVGAVRTTGKLPLYLAAGRFVLASRVGEAALVLDDDMLVDYAGVVDPTYPHKLAARVTQLLQTPHTLEQRTRSRELAARHFDYDILAARMGTVLDNALGTKTSETIS
jgi:glycosyltransferase involved in cell wall biosynthesis